MYFQKGKPKRPVGRSRVKEFWKNVSDQLQICSLTHLKSAHATNALFPFLSEKRVIFPCSSFQAVSVCLQEKQGIYTRMRFFFPKLNQSAGRPSTCRLQAHPHLKIKPFQ